MTRRQRIAARIEYWTRAQTFTLGEWLLMDIGRWEYTMRQAIEAEQLLAAKEDAKDAGVWA